MTRSYRAKVAFTLIRLEATYVKLRAWAFVIFCLLWGSFMTWKLLEVQREIYFVSNQIRGVASDTSDISDIKSTIDDTKDAVDDIKTWVDEH